MNNTQILMAKRAILHRMEELALMSEQELFNLFATTFPECEGVAPTEATQLMYLLMAERIDREFPDYELKEGK